MPEFLSSSDVLLVTAFLAYLLGSIPFGMVITRLMGLGDLRQIGSGNIGATNVLRTGNKLAAALTLILDGAKGAVAVLLAQALVGHQDAMQVAGLAAFAGHLWPVWLRFKGGKGVATFLGIMLALSWPVGLACCAAWLVGAAFLRISAAAALFAAATSTAWVVIFGQGQMLVLTFIFTVLIYIRHAGNLSRIRAGTEPKIGEKAKPVVKAGAEGQF